MCAALLSACAAASWSQKPDSTEWRWPAPSALASLSAAGALYWVPALTNWNALPPECAPCDRSSVPAFDRWAIGPERRGWSAASTVLVLGLAGVTWIDQGQSPAGMKRIMASVESAAWAAALTELGKAAFDRRRPVLYTDQAADAAGAVDSHRSLPSAHTAIAFALATSYALDKGEHAGWATAGVFAVAASVGAMRVAARRHFPSDVVAGALVGTGTAVVLRELRF